MSAAPGDFAVGRRLPSRPALPAGQALDSYLEHLAEANHLRPADLSRLITATTDTVRFLMLTPSARTLTALSAVTGLPREQLRAATLAQYDGTVLDLTGLEHHRPASYRALSAKGWLPGNGTQICPRCLRMNATWQLRWRLPTMTVCTRHGVYLVSTCPVCTKPFRATRHGFLRPSGHGPICGNALGARGQHCPTDLAELYAPRADPGCLERQTRYDVALAEGRATVLGETTSAKDYHHALRSLTTLLLHIASAADNPRDLPYWARHLNRDQRRGTSSRAPRWGIAPPSEPRLRSRALTAADRVLAAPSTERAAAELAFWTDHIPRTRDGVLGWAADHTLPDPTTTRLIMAVQAPRRRLSRALDEINPLTPKVMNIPQVIPEDLYLQHLSGLFTSRPETVRTFAALCLARTHPNVTTWAEAASGLGLSEEVGTQTAEACATGQTADTTRVLQALRALGRQMPVTDYRAFEQVVRHLGRAGDWFVRWVEVFRPGTACTSKAYTITWLWTHVAEGHLGTSPAWVTPPTANRRASYRRFAASLSEDQQRSLREVLAS
ncbi:TniQ family protein [Janibacter sp. DB-40]|uniref:TniQ family protein n=1 Tax=Janibacter sp. DB-40 TaxID=3028808 RepID=UPI0024057D49|nr:TniQ family protein [Janibacter sp. DB-40]